MVNVILIPARAGSKGVKNKNFLKVKGIPLSLRALTHANFIASSGSIICISSDSLKLIDLCAKFLNLKINEKCVNRGFVYIDSKFILHLRPPELSHDESIISDLLYHLQMEFNSLRIKTANWLILQPTSPFRSKDELLRIKQILKGRVNDPNFSLVSVTNVQDIHPARMYKIGGDGLLKPENGYKNFYYKRRQDFPEVLIRDGGFYVIGANLVAEKMQYSRSPFPFYRYDPWSLNIDKKKDLFLARGVMTNQINGDPNEGAI